MKIIFSFQTYPMLQGRCGRIDQVPIQAVKPAEASTTDNGCLPSSYAPHQDQASWGEQASHRQWGVEEEEIDLSEGIRRAGRICLEAWWN